MATQGNTGRTGANAESSNGQRSEQLARQKPASAADYERVIRSLEDKIRRLDSDMERNKAEMRKMVIDKTEADRQLDDARCLKKEAMVRASLTVPLLRLMGELPKVNRLVEKLSEDERVDALELANKAGEARKRLDEAHSRVREFLARSGQKKVEEWSSAEDREFRDVRGKESSLADEARNAAHNLYDKLFDLLSPSVEADDTKLRQRRARIKELQALQKTFDMGAGASELERREDQMNQRGDEIRKLQDEVKSWPSLVGLMGKKEEWGRNAASTK